MVQTQYNHSMQQWLYHVLGNELIKQDGINLPGNKETSVRIEEQIGRTGEEKNSTYQTNTDSKSILNDIKQYQTKIIISK